MLDSARGYTHLLGVVFLVLGTLGAAPPTEQAKRPSARPKAPVGAPKATTTTAFPNSPEGAYKTFILAMAAGDETTLRGVIVSAEGIEWLLSGEHVPTERLAAFRQTVVEKLNLRRLKPGEQVKLPDGKTLKVKPEEVSSARVILMQENLPVPTRCQKVGNQWRVDARPVVASRRASAQTKNAAKPTATPATRKPAEAPKK